MAATRTSGERCIEAASLAMGSRHLFVGATARIAEPLPVVMPYALVSASDGPDVLDLNGDGKSIVMAGWAPGNLNIALKVVTHGCHPPHIHGMRSLSRDIQIGPGCHRRLGDSHAPRANRHRRNLATAHLLFRQHIA